VSDPRSNRADPPERCEEYLRGEIPDDDFNRCDGVVNQFACCLLKGHEGKHRWISQSQVQRLLVLITQLRSDLAKVEAAYQHAMTGGPGGKPLSRFFFGQYMRRRLEEILVRERPASGRRK